MTLLRAILTLAVLALGAADAQAYVGPGLGLGAIGAFFGAVLAVLLAILGVFWYPLKRLIRKIRGEAADSEPEERE